jgi:hypothetical protein
MIPLTVIGAVATPGSIATSSGWDHLVLLVASGPCGAMPFVIALQYRVRTEVIAMDWHQTSLNNCGHSCLARKAKYQNWGCDRIHRINMI